MTAPTTDRARPNGDPAVPASKVDYCQRPMLVFWETTRACQVACRHCRASALTDPLPGELNPAEGRALVEQVAGFGVRTRSWSSPAVTACCADLFDLVEYATAVGVPVALSPSVTPTLTAQIVQRIAAGGVKAVSICLDGAARRLTKACVRSSTISRTVAAIRALVAAGLNVQRSTQAVGTSSPHRTPGPSSKSNGSGRRTSTSAASTDTDLRQSPPGLNEPGGGIRLIRRSDFVCR